MAEVQVVEVTEGDDVFAKRPVVRERRHKVIYIGVRELLEIAVQHMAAAPGYRIRHRVVGLELPKDFEVVNVCHDWQRNAFGFLISHPSFDPVPDGVPAPNLMGIFQFEVAYDRGPLDRPVSEGDLLVSIADALKMLGCEVAGKIDDPLRWTNSDLATDLAPLVKRILEGK